MTIKVEGGNRTQRFEVGARVVFTDYIAQMFGIIDLEPRTVLEAECQPLPGHVPGSGTSAKYRVSDYSTPVWDWMLQPAP